MGRINLTFHAIRDYLPNMIRSIFRRKPTSEDANPYPYDGVTFNAISIQFMDENAREWLPDNHFESLLTDGAKKMLKTHPFRFVLYGQFVDRN